MPSGDDVALADHDIQVDVLVWSSLLLVEVAADSPPVAVADDHVDLGIRHHAPPLGPSGRAVGRLSASARIVARDDRRDKESH